MSFITELEAAAIISYRAKFNNFYKGYTRSSKQVRQTICDIISQDKTISKSFATRDISSEDLKCIF